MEANPLGLDDFIKIREGGYYFVDKSDFIAEVLDSRAEVQLITRPRRFGKTINMTMLDAYLNVEYVGNAWFDGLKISAREDLERYRNRCPVISLSLKDSDTTTYDDFIQSFAGLISELYRRHSDSLATVTDPKLAKDSSELRMAASGKAVLGRSLRTLSEILFHRYGRGAVILLDEYDTPLQNAYGHGDFDRILGFTRTVLGSALKGNPYLDFAVITGITQIPEGSIFSGLNNMRVNSIFDTDYDEMFGFTADEVEALCRDYGHPEKFDEAREWYEGYHFGDAEVYNPWSLMSYAVKGFVPDTYWGGTSSNSIIRDLLANADDAVYSDLRTLGSGGVLKRSVDPRLPYRESESDVDSIFSTMVMAGYLTARSEGNGYSLSIPNREMYKVFAREISETAGSGMYMRIANFTDAVLARDTETMESELYELIAGTLSSRVLDNEHSYQAFMAGLLLHLEGGYTVGADFEEGRGYFDIRMESRTGRSPNVVIEIKRATAGTSPERLAEEALEQIVEKDYCHGLSGETVLYGVAFDGKVPVIRSRILRRSRTRDVDILSGGPGCSRDRHRRCPAMYSGRYVTPSTSLTSPGYSRFGRPSFIVVPGVRVIATDSFRGPFRSTISGDRHYHTIGWMIMPMYIRTRSIPS